MIFSPATGQSLQVALVLLALVMFGGVMAVLELRARRRSHDAMRRPTPPTLEANPSADQRRIQVPTYSPPTAPAGQLNVTPAPTPVYTAEVPSATNGYEIPFVPRPNPNAPAPPPAPAAVPEGALPDSFGIVMPPAPPPGAPTSPSDAPTIDPETGLPLFRSRP